MIKIFNKKNNQNLKLFQKTIVNEVLKDYKKFDDELENLHMYVNSKKINDLRLRFFKQINKLNWKKMIMNIASDEFFNLLGQDLMIQSKLNVSVQMPGDESSQLPLHSDSWSADSPFQINLWIPLTDAFDTNSMFIKDKKITLNVLGKIGKNKNIDFSKIKLEKRFC